METRNKASHAAHPLESQVACLGPEILLVGLVGNVSLALAADPFRPTTKVLAAEQMGPGTLYVTQPEVPAEHAVAMLRYRWKAEQEGSVASYPLIPGGHPL